MCTAEKKKKTAGNRLANFAKLDTECSRSTGLGETTRKMGCNPQLAWTATCQLGAAHIVTASTTQKTSA